MGTFLDWFHFGLRKKHELEKFSIQRRNKLRLAFALRVMESGLENLRSPLNQSGEKLKITAAWPLAFSRALVVYLFSL